jgi:hypothetical protein
LEVNKEKVKRTMYLSIFFIFYVFYY